MTILRIAAHGLKMFGAEAVTDSVASQSSTQVSVCVRTVKVDNKKTGVWKPWIGSGQTLYSLDISSQREDSSISYDRIFLHLPVSSFNERRP